MALLVEEAHEQPQLQPVRLCTTVGREWHVNAEALHRQFNVDRAATRMLDNEPVGLQSLMQLLVSA